MFDGRLWVTELRVDMEIGDKEALLTLFHRIAEEEGWHPGGELHTDVDRSTYFALWTMVEDERCLIGGLQIAHSECRWLYCRA